MEIGQEKYIAAARKELLQPTMAITQQYLEVNAVEMENGLPKVARVGIDYFPGQVAVFFPVKDEHYFFEVLVTKSERPRLDAVWIESGHRVYLTATTRKNNLAELEALTALSPISGWSIGDKRGSGRRTYKFTRLVFEPIDNRAYSLEEKLELLLDELEKDTSGVLALGEAADAWISVARYQYVGGNAGVNFSKEVIARMQALNLGIDIDTYISGRELPDD